MITARALPDEHYLSHLSRLLKLNQRDARSWFNAQPAGSDRSQHDNLTRFTALANTSGLSHGLYAKLHTLLPLHRRVGALNPSIDTHGVFDTRHTLGVDAFNSCKVGRACRSCIDEDIEWFGFAYWRRTHQVPGSAWCIKHEERLLITRTFKKPFLLAPSQALDRMILKRNPDLQGAPRRQVRAVKRYQEIATSLLGGNTCSSPENAACQITDLQGMPDDVSSKD